MQNLIRVIILVPQYLVDKMGRKYFKETVSENMHIRRVRDGSGDVK